jgi:hypothetical protein
VDPQPVGVRLDRRRLAAGRALGGDQRLADLRERPALLLRRPLRLGRAFSARSTATCSRSLPSAASASARVSPSGWLGMDEPEPALHLAAAVAPLRDPRVAFGPARGSASRCRSGRRAGSAATAALFVSGRSRLLRFYRRRCTTRCTTSAGSRVNSEQLRATQKVTFLQRKCWKKRDPLGPPGAYLWSRRSPVRIRSLTLRRRRNRDGGARGGRRWGTSAARRAVCVVRLADDDHRRQALEMACCRKSRGARRISVAVSFGRGRRRRQKSVVVATMRSRRGAAMLGPCFPNTHSPPRRVRPWSPSTHASS